jgi:hypothetical protein
MKAFIWQTRIEIRRNEAWVVGVGAASTSLDHARYLLQKHTANDTTSAPDFVLEAPTLSMGQMVEFTYRLIDMPAVKAEVSLHDA